MYMAVRFSWHWRHLTRTKWVLTRGEPNRFNNHLVFTVTQAVDNSHALIGRLLLTENGQGLNEWCLFTVRKILIAILMQIVGHSLFYCAVEAQRTDELFVCACAVVVDHLSVWFGVNSPRLCFWHSASWSVLLHHLRSSCGISYGLDWS